MPSTLAASRGVNSFPGVMAVVCTPPGRIYTTRIAKSRCLDVSSMAARRRADELSRDLQSLCGGTTILTLITLTLHRGGTYGDASAHHETRRPLHRRPH